MTRDGCRVLLVPIIVLTLGGCAAMQRQEAKSTEDLLVAAGFRPKVADTPAKVEHLKTMTPLKITTRVKDGQTIYSYADPVNCKCVYVGGPKEYQEYKRLEVEQRIAEDNRMAAEAATDAAMDWGLWGPWWW
jgi:hypothetical protein